MVGFLTEQNAVVRFHKPDLKEKIFYFLCGILVSVPMTLFFSGLTTDFCVVMPFFYAQFCAIVVLAPLIEEFSKVFPLFYRHGETERSIFVLGLLIGLGFGFAEFLIYVLVLDVHFLVRFPLIVFHACAASISAYGVAKKNPLPFLAVAVLLHFGNNLVALVFSGLWIIGGPVILLITYYVAYVLYRRSSNAIVV
jgi:RsiW-degrading membrane proteinase PrsW (M82 family)